MKDGNTYELVLIARDEQPEQIDKVKNVISGFEGTVTNERTWGKKRFAYPIQKQSAGYYQLWTVTLGSAHVAPFKRKLDLDENILRYLLIRN